MTLPETLYMKNVSNELIFPLVTHTTCFDTQFGRYVFFKSGYSADQIPDRLDVQMIDQVFGLQEGQNLLEFEYKFCRLHAQLFGTYSNTRFFITAAMVTAI
jgi:hypothetical protein